MKKAFNLALIALLASSCSRDNDEQAPTDEVTQSSAEINAPATDDPEPAEPTDFASSPSDTKLRGDALVAQDMAERFAAWVEVGSRGVWGAAVSDAAREKYAETQTNASVALLAYEEVGSFYSGKRAFAVAAVDCGIRTKEWSWSFDEKLSRDAAQDATLQASKKALTPVELATGDAYLAFLISLQAGATVGKDRARGCRALAAIPAMRIFDRYEAGQIDRLPRSISEAKEILGLPSHP